MTKTEFTANTEKLIVEVSEMSVCTFLAANYPMPEVAPKKEYPCHINVDEGKIFDGGADDNFFLRNFESVNDYTEKEYGVYLEWAYYTEGRARLVLEYIETILENTDSVELWHVWLMDYYEYDERPVEKYETITCSELTVDDIKKIDSADIWNTPDRNRPSFYCLRVIK